MSSDADMNTEVALLNKPGAASLIGLRRAQVIDATRKPDAEAQAINNHIRFMK